MQPARGALLRICALTGALLGAATSPAGARDTEEGIRLFAAQRYGEARTSLEEAVRENPSDARAALYLGRALFEQGEVPGSVHWLERAGSIDPSSSPASYWLGRAYGEQAVRGNLILRAKLAGKVRRAFERAVELDPDNLDARMALVEFYLRAPSFMGGSPQKAEAEAEGIRRRDPLRGHRAAARIDESRKRPDLAGAEYEAAAREFPNCPDPYYWLEENALERKDWTAAFAAMSRLEHALPGEAGALYETGRIASLSGRELDRGAESLRRYLERDPRRDEPSKASARLRLGEILEKRGDKDHAREEYSAALRLDPRLTSARQALARLH